MAVGTLYIASARIAQKTPLPTVIPFLYVTQPLTKHGCFSRFTVSALSKYATILTEISDSKNVEVSQYAG
jgi:hypothetical protein